MHVTKLGVQYNCYSNKSDQWPNFLPQVPLIVHLNVHFKYCICKQYNVNEIKGHLNVFKERLNFMTVFNTSIAS